MHVAQKINTSAPEIKRVWTFNPKTYQCIAKVRGWSIHREVVKAGF